MSEDMGLFFFFIFYSEISDVYGNWLILERLAVALDVARRGDVVGDARRLVLEPAREFDRELELELVAGLHLGRALGRGREVVDRVGERVDLGVARVGLIG